MKKVFNTIFENGIIISLFVGLAYLFTFQYQKGKLSYYGIPLTYADLSLSSVIENSFIILMVLFFVIIYLRPILDASKTANSYNSIRMINISIWFVIVLSINFAIVKKFNFNLAFIIIFYFCFLAFTFIAPLLSIKEKIPYSKKWANYSEKALKKRQMNMKVMKKDTIQFLETNL